VVQDPTIVQLSLPSNILVQSVGGNNPWPTWFEVGGSCNEGGYLPGLGQSSNVIKFSLTTANGTLISATSPSDPPASCVLGRFIISVNTNNDIYCNCSNTVNNYVCGGSHTVVVSSTVVDYTLQLQLLVTDSNGNQLPPNGVSDTQTMTLQCQQQCCQ
jgi:hypothetical protein